MKGRSIGLLGRRIGWVLPALSDDSSLSRLELPGWRGAAKVDLRQRRQRSMMPNICQRGDWKVRSGLDSGEKVRLQSAHA